MLGLVILFVGGHYLVQGATAIALLSRVSATVVGLTIVAMGTSLPELAVSVGAAARGATDLAYGNIVGSTIFNVGAILGVAALLMTIPIKRQTIRIEYPFMFAAGGAVLLLGRDRTIDHLEGIVLASALLLFIGYTIYLSRHDLARDEELALEREVLRTAQVEKGTGRAWGINVWFVLLGSIALPAGAELAVRGATQVALTLGVEDRIIGLTVVAMGTSLPELATSIVAARRGEPEIAIANVIGSNIFNLLGILGITAAVFTVPIHVRAASVDNWVMLAFCAALFPLMLTNKTIEKREGGILLLGFAAYITYLVIAG